MAPSNDYTHTHIHKSRRLTSEWFGVTKGLSVVLRSLKRRHNTATHSLELSHYKRDRLILFMPPFLLSCDAVSSNIWTTCRHLLTESVFLKSLMVAACTALKKICNHCIFSCPPLRLYSDCRQK